MFQNINAGVNSDAFNMYVKLLSLKLFMLEE